MPLGVFIVIDNKCKTRLVCQALVSDESFDTYVWILNCIKNATNQTPIMMFTNADPALDAVIPIVFPETYAAHCIFHITQNLPKNLKLKLVKNWNNFIKQFYQYHNSLSDIESTVRVEGYNWIIKQQLKTNSTLSTTTNTIPVIGQDLFPVVTKLFDKYLTEPINNIIKTKMSQCLFINVNMIELNDEELNCEQVMIDEVGQDDRVAY
ncbi:protein FAR1-related sequence 5-like [Rhizophagus clarus]|uniref:Protein FAR1-related sequence 5-like n=1 Tax=Rhizophagus clarus TaxID=94130 RepID=A0A8H3LPS5_9GLOM|nr:protein FAR1-related sequence 5-like [Rhizophagus clarus]